jgi:hypothetical protein
VQKAEMLLKKMADASKKSVMNIDAYQKSWKEGISFRILLIC